MGDLTSNGSFLDQKIEMFNFDSGQYEVIDQGITTSQDTVVTVKPTGDVSRFLEAETGVLRVRLTWQNGIAAFPAQMDCRIGSGGLASDQCSAVDLVDEGIPFVVPNLNRI